MPQDLSTWKVPSYVNKYISCCFSNHISNLPDQRYLLISSLNNQIQIIDITTEEEVKRFCGHVNSQRLVDVSYHYDSYSDKVFILSGSEDGNVCIWDLDDDNSQCQRIQIFNSPNAVVNTFTLSKSGILCVSGYPDEDNKIYCLKS